MQGKIVKGIAGSYDVYTQEKGLLDCKPKGIFRKDGVKPLPGDDVQVSLLDEEKKTGVITRVMPRKNELIRPTVANIDQALVIFAAERPAPNFNLLDRFLVMMQVQHIPAVICFNKTDAATEEALRTCREIYEATGYRMLFTSAYTGEGIEDVRACLQGKTTTVAGPSGVGKSSIINLLQGETQMETGAISERIARGKHTTRHTQLLPIDGETFILDTPGFGSLEAPQIEAGEVWRQFPEFVPYEPYCRFRGCMHLKEPDCGIRQALAEGKISPVRYEDYGLLVEEINNRRKY